MRQYPVLQALFPPIEIKQQRDPLRQPGAPVMPARAQLRSDQPKTSTTMAAGLGMAAAKDMIDFMVYGTDDHDTPEIHLSFREDVMAGVYLKLRFEAKGVQAIFIVRDQAGRRIALSYGEQLLARLATKGLRTDTVSVEMAKED
jgi:uncharacterized protein with ATP-grasp and redox domains